MPEAARGRVMDLRDLAWMVRHLDEPVSALHLFPDGGLIAGGWDGCVKRWDEQGELLWSASTPDRVMAVTPWGDALALTAGLHVVVLDLATGKERWSRPLEGSADLQCVVGEHLLTTSSVYDIEHFDFLESAFWLHDANGEERHVHRLDERPWDVIEHDGELLFGLGRPRGGLLATKDGRTFEHRAINDAAVLAMAHDAAGPLVLSSLGDLVRINGDHVEGLANADAMHIGDGRVFLSDEAGGFACIDHGVAWSLKGAPVTAAATVDGEEGFVAVARWSGAQGHLEMVEVDGASLVTYEVSKIEAMVAEGARLAMGTQAGDVIVLDAPMLRRRLTQGEGETEAVDDEAAAHRAAMLAKLKALRN